MSYAAMRSQSMARKIHHNCDRRASARQAAMTGLTMAIKKIHQSDWGGVGTELSGSLGSYQSFQVTFTAGDPALSADDPDYDNLPYRVTLLSTGYSADPDNPTSIATHQVRAVARLVPRNLEDEPSDWTRMQQYTVFQSRQEDFELDIPCRVEGPLRIQGKLKVARHYPDDGDAWLRYLGDLQLMRLNGHPDYRPIDGPLELLTVAQDGSQMFVVVYKLGVTVINKWPHETASDWTKPTSLVSYQIYAGGPVYTTPNLASTLENVTLQPDPVTNPLGIYYDDGSVTIRDNVTIRGSLFAKDDIRVEGANVHFQPAELPALHGSETPVRLPVASCQNFLVKPGAEGSLTGFLAVFDKFEIEKSPETVEFAITGRVVARKFYIKERQPWEQLNWHDYYHDGFLKQPGPTQEQFFPVWMGLQGRDPRPRLTVKPDPSPVRYHWHYPQDLIYVPHPDDEGLRWELVRWTDSP